MFRIIWKSNLTEAAGQGEPMDKSLAKAWLAYVQEKWDGIIDHRLELV